MNSALESPGTVGARTAAVRRETVISIAINAFLPTGVIWTISADPPTQLIGDQPLLAPLILAPGLATFAMTFVVTAIFRHQLRRGTVPGASLAETPPLARWLPRLLILRAAILAMIAIALFAPLGALVSTGLGILPLTTSGFALFNIVMGSAVGLAMTPLVARRALADQGNLLR